MRLEEIIEEIIKWCEERELKKKIISYKNRLNEKEESGKTEQNSGDKLSSTEAEQSDRQNGNKPTSHHGAL